MTKAELVDAIADKAGISKRDAEGALKALLESIEDALKQGEDVQLTGFGKFSVSQRAAREGVNPRDPGGAKITIAARKVPRFTPGAALKAAVDR
ncbi:MAG: HU family DNA-binding protein, partial [Actinomycetota bacterium]